MKNTLEYFEEDNRKFQENQEKKRKLLNILSTIYKKNNIEYSLGKYNTVFLKKNSNSNKTIILQAHIQTWYVYQMMNMILKIEEYLL